MNPGSRYQEEDRVPFDIAYFEGFLAVSARSEPFAGFHGCSAEFSISVRDLGKRWHLKIEGGTLAGIAAGSNARGDVDFVVDSQTFAQIASGEVSPQQAYLAGKAEIKGNLLQGMRIAKMLADFFRARPYPQRREQPDDDAADGIFQELLNVELETGVTTTIRAAYDDNTDCSRMVVVFPPHPLLGGDADNSLVRAVCDEAVAQGYLAITFNYRGIDGGQEPPACWQEMERTKDYSRIVLDAQKLVLDALGSFGHDAELHYVGYSFGCLVALALNRHLKARRTVAISPPILAYDFEPLLTDNGPVTMMASPDDGFSPFGKASEMADRLGFTVSKVDAGDHFYRGQEKAAATMAINHMESIS
jgi:alpha/beta superfamily hydrolase/putative sterol carrier protein